MATPPLHPLPDDPHRAGGAASRPPAGSRPGQRLKLTQEGAPRKRLVVAEALEPEPPPAVEPGDVRPTAAPDPPGFPHIEVDTPHASPTARRGAIRANPKTTKAAWWLAGGVTVVAVLLALGAIIGMGLRESGRPAKPVEMAREPSRPEQASSPASSPLPETKPDWPVLSLEWPEADRVDAAVLINGNKTAVPPAGPVEYSLPPSRHRIVLLRRGYEPVELFQTLRAGEHHHYKPVWNEPAPLPPPEPTFDDWLQDFELAKTQAAADGKDVLIAFDGSDWCGWSERIAREVFLQREFRAQADKQFVLVFVDLPQGREAKAKVHDAGRNGRLAEQFGIQEVPTIVLTDAKGRPYGCSQGFVEGGVNAFMASLARLQEIKKRRDELFATIQSADVKVAAVHEAIELLKHHELIQFYGPTLAEWLALARRHDPQNAAGFHEVVFEAKWLLDVAQSETPDRVREIVEELDAWKKTCRFRDADRAARLHLAAVGLLVMLRDTDQASRFAQAGAQFQPKDKSLFDRLRRAAALTNPVRPAGSGFVVSADGHVLTNHHVVKGVERTLVQLPGMKEPLPARVLSEDTAGDLALLKVEVPSGSKLQPVCLSTTMLSRGAAVGAFGFPLGESVGSGIKLTTGVVSATAEQTVHGMLLLDCRVNPGNSGGPLCDTRGNVVGVVTAKSLSGFGLDSYGMAIPARTVRDFLGEHLPRFETRAAGNVRREWDEIDRLVSPSVVMILAGG